MDVLQPPFNWVLAVQGITIQGRIKLLIHLRRMSNLLDKAFREGLDGTLK